MEHSEALSITGAYSQQCKSLLRHSMAAIIVSTVGYTMTFFFGVVSIATVAIPSGVGFVYGTFVGYVLLMILFTLPMSLAGSVLIKLPDRQFTSENLRKLRNRSIAGVAMSAIAAIGALVMGLVMPLVNIRHTISSIKDVQVTGDTHGLNPQIQQRATEMLYSGVVVNGVSHVAYFTACLVVCSLLLRSTKQCMRIAVAGPKHSGRQYMAV